MKKLVVLIVISTFFSISGYCQNHERNYLVDVLDEYALNKHLKYEPTKTNGSPYLNKMFTPAMVSGVSKNTMMRYDAYSDEFEFVNAARDTLVLNKVKPYTDITFTITNTKYQLVDYNNDGKITNGYLISRYEKNNLKLFKKENVVYNKERIATTGFDKSSPANFERGSDAFYLKDGDKIISEFPSNRKGLLKAYPEKKAALEAFLKQNAIDFKKESDIIRLIDFLAA